MLRDITLGQYYPIDSVIHRLDPRTKLFGTMIFIISLFIANSWPGYALATLFLVAAISLSKVPVKFMVKGLKAVLILLIISVSFNLFLTDGEVVFKLWIIKITKEGIRISIFMGLRLIFLIVGSSVMTLTTTPNALTDGLEKSLGFLKVIKIEETDKIMKAQMARGADFESGNIIQKAKAMVPLLVPLFISAMRRATDLAMAMEARCYHGGEGRTKLKPLKYKKIDIIAYLYYLIYMLICIALVFVFRK